MIRKLIFTLLFLAYSSQAAALTNKEHARRTHDAYVSGEFAVMTQFMKEAFEAYPEDEILHKNLLSLLEAAYKQDKRDDIKPGWALPKEIQTLSVTVYRHTYSEDLYWGYDLVIGGHVTKDALKDFKLTDQKGDIILHKEGKVGRWNEGDQSHGHWSFKSQTHIGKIPPKPGLYFMTFEIADHDKPVQLWFLLPLAAAKNYVEIITPKPNGTLKGHQPKLQWKDYRSDFFEGFDDNTISAHISAKACEWHTVHYISSDTPFSKYKVGQTPEGFKKDSYQSYNMSHDEFTKVFSTPNLLFSDGVNELPNGKHNFSITYLESRSFGPMGFDLETMNNVYFDVKDSKAKPYDCDNLPWKKVSKE